MFLINIRIITHMNCNKLWNKNKNYTRYFETPHNDGIFFSRMFLIRDGEGYTCNMDSLHGLDNDCIKYEWDLKEQLRRENFIKMRIRIAEKLGLQ